MFKQNIRKINLGIFMWSLLGFFLLLCLLGMVNNRFFNPDSNYFEFVLKVIDGFFSFLGFFLNPILAPFTRFRFRPIFGGIPDSLYNKNPIIFRTLSEAALQTLEISVVSMVVGFFIGMFLAVILIIPGKSFGLKHFASAYVDLFRSTPLLLQMLIVYLSVPQIVQSFGDLIGIIDLGVIEINYTRFNFDGLTAATIALSLNTGAYQAELIRAGILSIPTGQTEAARGLGLTQTKTYSYVIIPQALRLIIPPLTNEGINVVLNSSLAYALAVPELTRKATDLGVKWFLTVELLTMAAIFYFIMAFSLAKITKKLEKRMRIPGLGVYHE